MARYIDADKLKEQLVKKYWQNEEKLGIKHPSVTAIEKCVSILDRMPTADVREVKHGKWIVRHRHEHYPSGKAYDENVCPFCKRADHNGDGIFCGYCGEKMDGKK